MVIEEVDPRLANGNAIEFTPKKDLAKKYRYLCPICMMYFKRMYQSVCCNNYICQFCYRDLFEGFICM